MLRSQCFCASCGLSSLLWGLFAIGLFPPFFQLKSCGDGRVGDENNEPKTRSLRPVGISRSLLSHCVDLRGVAPSFLRAMRHTKHVPPVVTSSHSLPTPFHVCSLGSYP